MSLSTSCYESTEKVFYVCNHLEIYIPRSLNICIYMLSRTRSWNKRAQWAAAASVFLLFLQGISILGSKHFRVQTLPIYKKMLINMHGPIVFVQSNPNQTPQDFTLSLQQRLSAASMLVIPEHCPCGKERNQQSAGAAPVGSSPHTGKVCWTGDKRSSFYPDSRCSSWPKKGNSVIQQDLKAIEVTQIAPQKNKRKASGSKEGLALKERQVFEEKTCFSRGDLFSKGTLWL